jgi:hypothetical protein
MRVQRPKREDYFLKIQVGFGLIPRNIEVFEPEMFFFLAAQPGIEILVDMLKKEYQQAEKQAERWQQISSPGADPEAGYI